MTFWEAFAVGFALTTLVLAAYHQRRLRSRIDATDEAVKEALKGLRAELGELGRRQNVDVRTTQDVQSGVHAEVDALRAELRRHTTSNLLHPDEPIA